jgi:hypothetical protein
MSHPRPSRRRWASQPSISAAAALVVLAGCDGRRAEFDRLVYDVWSEAQARTGILDKFYRVHAGENGWAEFMSEHHAINRRGAREILSLRTRRRWWSTAGYVKVLLYLALLVLVLASLQTFIPGRLRIYSIVAAPVLMVMVWFWDSGGFECLRLPEDADGEEQSQDASDDEDTDTEGASNARGGVNGELRLRRCLSRPSSSDEAEDGHAPPGHEQNPQESNFGRRHRGPR